MEPGKPPRKTRSFHYVPMLPRGYGRHDVARAVAADVPTVRTHDRWPYLPAFGAKVGEQFISVHALHGASGGMDRFAHLLRIVDKLGTIHSCSFPRYAAGREKIEPITKRRRIGDAPFFENHLPVPAIFPWFSWKGAAANRAEKSSFTA